MLKVISLFTGAGGLDFGFEAAGFRTSVAVELDSTCCRTLRLNREWPVIEADIHRVTSRQLLKIGGLRKGQADVLIGGPPCQPFSKSGYWVDGDAARLKDQRADTLSAFLRMVRDTQPKTLLLENVYGLAYKGKDEGLGRILDGLRQINEAAGTNYKPYWQVLDAASYGVPQHRERVFVIASREGRHFEFPRPTHGNVEDLFQRRKFEPYRSVWDALGDLPEDPNDPELRMSGKWADLLPSIPEGQNYLWHTTRGGGRPLFGWRTRYWNFLLKLAKDRPSWTLQAQPGPATGPFHWRNRKLSAVELCRLQTFPTDVTFDCSRAEVQRMLGNAVPSLVAEVLAREIRAQLLDRPLRFKKPKLLPPRRESPPKAEPVSTVHRKYLSLEGEHRAHPGTGQGNRARARRVA